MFDCYKEFGIRDFVLKLGEKTEKELAERFAEIDANAELCQMKVLRAMQKNRVS